MMEFARNKLYLIFKAQSKLVPKKDNNEDPSFQCHIREWTRELFPSHTTMRFFRGNKPQRGTKP